MFSEIGERNKNIIVTCTFLAIVLFALILRLKDIDSFPFDFDEGIHGYYSYQLYKTGVYVYDASYHGPFLYYMTAGVFALLGDSIITARLTPALFGAAMILLLYPMRRHLGRVGFLTTSALFAFSPLYIMYSQVLRNDVYLVFFTLATVVCVLLYLEQKKNTYLMLGAASLALTFTIKENAYITLFVFGSFLALYYSYKILISHDKIGTTKDIIAEISQKIKQNHLIAFVCAVVFLAIYTAPFFMYFNGFFEGWFASFHFWFKTGYLDSFDPKIVRIQPLFQPFYTYLVLLIRYELPVLILAAAGIIYYSLIEKSKFMQFISYWAIVSLAIYSFIPYKTPWLSLHMLLPLILLAGTFLGKTFEFLLSEPKLKKKVRGERREKKRVNKKNHIFAISIIILLIGCFYAYSLSSVSHETNEGYNELYQYVKDISNENFEANVFVAVRADGSMYHAYWPLPWYIREYTSVVSIIVTPHTDERDIKEVVKTYKPIIISPKWATEYLDAPLQELGYEKKAFDCVKLIVYNPR